MDFKVVLSCGHLQYYTYLRQHGFDVTEVHMRRNDEAETIEKMKGFEGIAAMGELYNARVLDELKEGNLKVLVRHGIGYDRVDLAHAEKLGICCCNTPGTMSGGVAETTVAMLLECTRKFYQCHNRITQGGWGCGPVANGLEGATVGLIGFGNIAQRTAQYLMGFHCNILAYDICYNEEALARLHVRKASIEEITAQSDFVSLHLPATPKTENLVDDKFLAAMKPTAFLINTSRGALVDEQALIRALKDKTIAGAGLDVFKHEPLAADDPLRKTDNVFLTPHMATQTHDCLRAGFDGVIRCFNEYLEGKVPAFCLNPGYVNHL